MVLSPDKGNKIPGRKPARLLLACSVLNDPVNCNLLGSEKRGEKERSKERSKENKEGGRERKEGKALIIRDLWLQFITMKGVGGLCNVLSTTTRISSIRYF